MYMHMLILFIGLPAGAQKVPDIPCPDPALRLDILPNAMAFRPGTESTLAMAFHKDKGSVTSGVYLLDLSNEMSPDSMPDPADKLSGTEGAGRLMWSADGGTLLVESYVDLKPKLTAYDPETEAVKWTKTFDHGRRELVHSGGDAFLVHWGAEMSVLAVSDGENRMTRKWIHGSTLTPDGEALIIQPWKNSDKLASERWNVATGKREWKVGQPGTYVGATASSRADGLIVTSSEKPFGLPSGLLDPNSGDYPADWTLGPGLFRCQEGMVREQRSAMGGMTNARTCMALVNVDQFVAVIYIYKRGVEEDELGRFLSTFDVKPIPWAGPSAFAR